MLFGAVRGVLGRSCSPMFSGRELTPDDLVVPWLSTGVFMIAGLALSFAVRPDPKTIGEAIRPRLFPARSRLPRRAAPRT